MEISQLTNEEIMSAKYMYIGKDETIQLLQTDEDLANWQKDGSIVEGDKIAIIRITGILKATNELTLKGV